MKRKFLEELGIDKELIDKIIDEHGRGVNVLKSQVETLKEQTQKYQDDIKERDGQLEELKKVNVDELQATIEQLQSENQAKDEAHQKEMHQMKVETAIDKAIADKKGKNSTAIKALLNSANFNLDEVDFNDDGTVKGLAVRLDELIKTDEYLFDTSKSQLNFKGVNPGESGNEVLDGSMDDKSTWSYDDFVLAQTNN